MELAERFGLAAARKLRSRLSLAAAPVPAARVGPAAARNPVAEPGGDDALRSPSFIVVKDHAARHSSQNSWSSVQSNCLQMAMHRLIVGL